MLKNTVAQIFYTRQQKCGDFDKFSSPYISAIQNSSSSEMPISQGLKNLCPKKGLILVLFCVIRALILTIRLINL